MKYALVNTIEMSLSYWVDAVGDPISPEYIRGHMTTVNAQPGTVINLIVYDGESEYTPEEGLRLAEVPDEAKIGDTGY